MNGYSKDFWSQPCDEWKDLLATAASDDFSAAERQELNSHLTWCRSCSTTLKEYQAIDASLARFTAKPLPGLPPQLLQLWERENQPRSILSPMAITTAAAAVFIPLVSVTVSIIIGGTLLTAVAVALALGGIAAAALTL